MIILAPPIQKSMKSVVRLLLHPATWVCLLLFAAPLSTNPNINFESDYERIELDQKEAPRYATSPGHTVFGEYVGAHWCPPCMDSSSPSLANLKSSNPEEFTYVSFFEAPQPASWPNDSPINRRAHVEMSSTGYPTFSFADQQSGTCYKVGSTGTSYYDADFSAGGCMSPSSSDFELKLSMSLNSTTEQVSVTLEAIYTGSDPTVDVFVYGAITEKIGADAYDNGYRPHHNWRGWLLNAAGNGFHQMTLVKDTWSQHSWDAPLSLVRASSGNTQWENFWPVLALMDGPHTSYNEFFVAVDPDMGPLIDVGIAEFSVENTNQEVGFIPGDDLEINLAIRNNGAEQYISGGEMEIYLISGSEEELIGDQPIGVLGIGESSNLQVEFSTSEIEQISSGVSTFRAKLTGMSSDRNASNNVRDEVAYHDLPPTPTQPSATGSTSFERGDEVIFESSAIANDLVDDMTTMSPTMEYSKSGSGTWDDSWISDPVLSGAGANAVYAHSIQTPPSAETGTYDTRVKWTDASGQQSDWLTTSEAFELRNALPRVLVAGDSGFAGVPAVKIDTLEKVSLFGLVSDAETPISMLIIDSEDPEFRGWDPSTSEITVQFDTIHNDLNNNPIPQGIYISIDDGEDVNHGMLQFNVIENGAPRWAPVPTQPVFEGESASTILTAFLSDFNDDGEPVSASDLSLQVVSNSNEDLIQVSIDGHTITAITLDDDSNGVSEVVVKADDGAKSSLTSIVFFVINVNDAPEVDLKGLNGMTLKSGEQASVQLAPLISDIDDPDDEVWVDVDTTVPGAAHFNHLDGVLSMKWESPGSHSVKLTLIDSHGDWSAHTFTVSVLDSKPIEWDPDSGGDLGVELEDFSIGMDPTITLNYSGDDELSQVEVRWSICNGIVGICHSAGTNDGWGPFIAVSSGGNGMSIGDYLTLSAKAVDDSGWDWETVDKLDILLPTTSEPEEEIQVVDEGDEPSEAQQSSGGSSGLSSLEIIAGVLALLLFIGGGTLVGLYLSGALGNGQRIPRHNEPTQHRPEPEYRGTIDFEEPDSEEPETQEQNEETHPPIPEGGLPEGWTMEQWNYYGEQWLERQK